MEIDSVYIDNYNANPYLYLKDSENNWKYDVIFFGTWDSNGGKELNNTSANATREFINAGKGCIFGHDTVAGPTSSYTNFSSFRTYLGINSGTKTFSENVYTFYFFVPLLTRFFNIIIISL